MRNPPTQGRSPQAVFVFLFLLVSSFHGLAADQQADESISERLRLNGGSDHVGIRGGLLLVKAVAEGESFSRRELADAPLPTPIASPPTVEPPTVVPTSPPPAVALPPASPPIDAVSPPPPTDAVSPPPPADAAPPSPTDVVSPPPEAPPTPVPTTPRPPSPPAKKPNWVLIGAVGGGGALVAALLLLLILCCCCCRRKDARGKSPFADKLASALGLQSVKRFKTGPGRQFLRAVNILQITLASRQVITPVSLMTDNAVADLADSTAEVLRARYSIHKRSGAVVDEGSFIEHFTEDVASSKGLSQLVQEIENMYRYRDNPPMMRAAVPAGPGGRAVMV